MKVYTTCTITDITSISIDIMCTRLSPRPPLLTHMKVNSMIYFSVAITIQMHASEGDLAMCTVCCRNSGTLTGVNAGVSVTLRFLCPDCGLLFPAVGAIDVELIFDLGGAGFGISPGGSCPPVAVVSPCPAPCVGFCGRGVEGGGSVTGRLLNVRGCRPMLLRERERVVS